VARAPKKPADQNSAGFVAKTSFMSLFLRFLVLVSVFVAFFAQYVSPAGMPSFDFKRWVLLCALSLVVLGFSSYVRLRLKEAPLFVAGACIFLVSAFVSTLYAKTIAHELTELFFWSISLLAMSSIVFAFGQVIDVRKFAIYFVSVSALISVIFVILVLLLFIVYLNGDERQFDPIVLLGFANIRYWSHLASLLIPILPILIICSNRVPFRYSKYATYLVLSGFWWLLFVTTARGAILSILVSGVLIFLLFRRGSIRWIRVSLGGMVLGLALYLFSEILLPQFIQGSEASIRTFGTSSSGRIELWTMALKKSLEIFPLGIGSMSWVHTEALNSLGMTGEPYSHPHNMYLLWAAENGWLSVLGASMVFLSGAKRLINKSVLVRKGRADELDSTLLVGFSVSILASASHAGLSMMYLAPASMLVVLFVAPIFWYLTKPEGDRDFTEQGYENRSWSSRVWLVIALSSSLLLIQKTAIYYSDMKKDEVTYRASIYNGFAPRFWFHGQYPRGAEMKNIESR
jgi:O-antigen ligase